MLSIIKSIAKVFAALNSNSKASAIALAVSSALLLAFIPSGNLIWIIILLMSILLRANLAFEIVFILIFKALYSLIGGSIEGLGWTLMNVDSIKATIYMLLNMPLAIFFGINNSLVIGGLAVGLICWIPLFILSLFGLKLFRTKISPAIANLKFVKAIKKLPLIGTLLKAVKQYNGMYR
ncbi:TIGR03546 family protein [Spirochaeta cellobiosiphila]|uniref:TIGR03546 family protein n=1 Tax=Spirochaeta cellobiosiphila TaxID=504483 RepID=UPI0004181104|nr:TIGR03546 family protein [Spirochaeta cellobiosiphila]